MRRTVLLGADLSFTVMYGADLTQANVKNAELVKAELAGAQLARAKFVGANLEGAQFSSRDLFGAWALEGTVFPSAASALEGAFIDGLSSANAVATLGTTFTEHQFASWAAMKRSPAGLPAPQHGLSR